MSGPIILPALPVAGATIAQLRKAIYDWAYAATALTVIWADQQGTKPPKPFVQLNLTGPFKVTGIDWQEQVNQATGSSQRFTVGVAVFTDPPTAAGVLDAAQYISDLMMSLDDQILSDNLAEAGIGVGIVHSPQDLSQALDTKFERRIAFDWEANTIGARVQIANPSIQITPVPSGTFTY